MTLHLCRDFLTQNPTSSTSTYRYFSLYVSTLFLRYVMGFSVVGQTNFDVNSSTFTIASGFNTANLNLGTGLERAVQLPLSYTVSVADVGRIIVLKSNSYPITNSGLFRVSAFDSATNSLIVSYRTMLDQPYADVNISWALCEAEHVATALFQNGNNTLATGTYRGWGDSVNSRIILQSPHSTGWQLRIAAENSTDTSALIGAACSFTPGLGGNSAGDFAPGGYHLHIPLWFNSTTSTHLDGMVPGHSSNSGAEAPRYYMWGDDSSGTCIIVSRQHGNVAANNIVIFGLSEDEELPLPSSVIYRLFSFGGTAVGGNKLEINPGVYTSDGMMGVAFGYSNQPISCVPGSWCYLSINAANSNNMNESYASDSIFTGKSELLSWDLFAGTWDHGYDPSTKGITLEPRRIGRLPIIRRGRENFNIFSTSTDSERNWLHLQNGLFLPWSGSIVP